MHKVILLDVVIFLIICLMLAGFITLVVMKPRGKKGVKKHGRIKN